MTKFEINEELVKKHNEEEKKPENRFKQVKEILNDALFQSGTFTSSETIYHPESASSLPRKYLIEKAIECIDRHIAEIKKDEMLSHLAGSIQEACDAADTILYMMEDIGIAESNAIYDERYSADEKAYHEECKGEKDYDPSGFTPAGREMFECIYNEFRGDE